MSCACEYHTLEGTSTHTHQQPLTMPLVWPSNSLFRNFLEISIIYYNLSINKLFIKKNVFGS